MTTTLKLQKCSSPILAGVERGGSTPPFPLQFFTLNPQNTLSPSLSSFSVSAVEKSSPVGQAQSAACLQLRAAYINLTGQDAWQKHYRFPPTGSAYQTALRSRAHPECLHPDPVTWRVLLWAEEAKNATKKTTIMNATRMKTDAQGSAELWNYKSSKCQFRKVLWENEKFCSSEAARCFGLSCQVFEKEADDKFIRLNNSKWIPAGQETCNLKATVWTWNIFL